MSVYVVDASVAAKWFLPEQYTESARRVLAPENDLHAPDLFLVEIDSVLCRHIRRGELSIAEGDEIRRSLVGYPIQYTPLEELRTLAYAMANQTRTTPYDCLYLALAVLLGGQMVTADRRFYDRVTDGALAPSVLWVEDVP